MFSGMNFQTMILRLPVVFLAITVHEYAHAYAAYKMGDNTAKAAGRLSMNPLKHMDILGAICLLIFSFGWAKPVPINPYNFRNKKYGTVIVSLAGPMSNLLLALIGSILLGIFSRFAFGSFNVTFAETFYSLMIQLIILNVSLAIFNLIPIPPLDGSKIFSSLLPSRYYFKLMQYERYSFIILLLLLYTGIIGKFLGIFVNPILRSLDSVVNLIMSL